MVFLFINDILRIFLGIPYLVKLSSDDKMCFLFEQQYDKVDNNNNNNNFLNGVSCCICFVEEVRRERRSDSRPSNKTTGIQCHFGARKMCHWGFSISSSLGSIDCMEMHEWMKDWIEWLGIDECLFIIHSGTWATATLLSNELWNPEGEVNNQAQNIQ